MINILHKYDVDKMWIVSLIQGFISGFTFFI